MELNLVNTIKIPNDYIMSESVVGNQENNKVEQAGMPSSALTTSKVMEEANKEILVELSVGKLYAYLHDIGKTMGRIQLSLSDVEVAEEVFASIQLRINEEYKIAKQRTEKALELAKLMDEREKERFVEDIEDNPDKAIESYEDAMGVITGYKQELHHLQGSLVDSLMDTIEQKVQLLQVPQSLTSLNTAQLYMNSVRANLLGNSVQALLSKGKLKPSEVIKLIK